MSVNSFGISNMIDVLSGKGYIYFPDEENEKDLKKLLVGHSIKKVNYRTLELDNGVILEFIGNDGCCCGAGCYSVEELNDCDNIITNVEFEDEILDDSSWRSEHSYKIFVFAENKKIKLMQCDGDDGNGYYGTGYHINVKLKEKEQC